MRARDVRIRGAALALFLALAAPVAARAGEGYRTIPTRPGVDLPVEVAEPSGAAAATVLLLPGGDGRAGLSPDRPPRSRNFLVRTQALFVAQGLRAVVVDAPSDREAEGLLEWRGSAGHLADMAALVAWVRARWPQPVWLVGTSRGTISVAHLAAAGLPVDGVVFTSSVTERARRHPDTVLDADLSRIRVPALIVHNRDDACPQTPLAGERRILDAMSAASPKALILLQGGDTPISGPCEARAYHGFLGIERQAVDAIAGWIRSPAAGAGR